MRGEDHAGTQRTAGVSGMHLAGGGRFRIGHPSTASTSQGVATAAAVANAANATLTGPATFEATMAPEPSSQEDGLGALGGGGLGGTASGRPLQSLQRLLGGALNTRASVRAAMTPRGSNSKPDGFVTERVWEAALQRLDQKIQVLEESQGALDQRISETGSTTRCVAKEVEGCSLRIDSMEARLSEFWVQLQGDLKHKCTELETQRLEFLQRCRASTLDVETNNIRVLAAVPAQAPTQTRANGSEPGPLHDPSAPYYNILQRLSSVEGRVQQMLHAVPREKLYQLLQTVEQNASDCQKLNQDLHDKMSVIEQLSQKVQALAQSSHVSAEEEWRQHQEAFSDKLPRCDPEQLVHDTESSSAAVAAEAAEGRGDHGSAEKAGASVAALPALTAEGADIHGSVQPHLLYADQEECRQQSQTKLAG